MMVVESLAWQSVRSHIALNCFYDGVDIHLMICEEDSSRSTRSEQIRERLAELWSYLTANQTRQINYGRESHIACLGALKLGFQPVSSVDYGWLAVLSGRRFRIVWMKNRSWLVVRYRLEAYATLRRCQVAAGTRERLQEDFHTSRASPESKVA
jgi:hypothetical protein